MDQNIFFHVGDEVITDDGRVGKITSICTCDRCEARGFYEPTVDFHNGYNSYITHWDYDNDFCGYYKIGDYVFGNLDLESVESTIKKLQKRLNDEVEKRDVILRLLMEE